MLIDLPNRQIGNEREAADYVAAWMERRFIYTRDPARTAEGLPPDRWPTREELEAMYLARRAIYDDCDGSGFGCVYGLADLGFKARVHCVWTEPVADAADTLILPRYHMLCETESGYVIDSRFAHRVLTWGSREFAQYTRDRFSGFFEFGEIKQWFFDRDPLPPGATA